MSRSAKPYFFAAVITGVIFLLINTFGFAIHRLLHEPQEEWSVRFKHGTLYLNDAATGMVWGDISTGVVLSVVFLISFFLVRMKRK